MTLCIQPDDLVWRTFSSASAPERDDASRVPHPSQALMADYLRAFFRSHGEIREPDSAVLNRWLNSSHSFTAMMQALLPELQARHTLQPLDVVVFAHWTPDSDLGCAVSNALITRAKLTVRSGFPFRIAAWRLRCSPCTSSMTIWPAKRTGMRPC